MNVTYCKGWFRAHRRMLEGLPTDRARRAHDKGRLYTAVLGDAARPHAFVDVRLEVGHVGVHFLDEQLRVCLTYDFRVVGDGQMFLGGATYLEFEGDSDDRSRRTTIFKFSQAGEMDLLEYFDGQQREGRQTGVDVSVNWEPLPSFGDYRGVTKLERDAGGMTPPRGRD